MQHLKLKWESDRCSKVNNVDTFIPGHLAHPVRLREKNGKVACAASLILILILFGYTKNLHK